QTRRDGQPQPGPAVLPGRRGIGLREGLEDQLLLLGGDSDARVAHLKRQGGRETGRQRDRRSPGGSRPCRPTSLSPRLLVSLSSEPGANETETTTSPRSVNLIALPTRLTMICRSRPGSPISASGTSDGMW